MPQPTQPDFVPNPVPRPSPRGGKKVVAVACGRWLLLTGFALFILVPPLLQIVVEVKDGKKLSIVNFPTNTQQPIATRLRAYENQLEEASVVEKAFRTSYSEVIYDVFREGNHKVVVGLGDTLHYRSDIDSIVGRDPTRPVPHSVTKELSDGKKWVSSVDAILDFAAQLKERNIQLMLVPVPVKASIYPESLNVNAERPVTNPLQESIYEKLRSAGVDVVDVGPALWAFHRKSPMYLNRDTHWTPEGMAQSALEIASAVKSYKEFPNLAAASKSFSLELVPQAITNIGDLNLQLSLPRDSKRISYEAVLTRKIYDRATGKPVQPDPESPIVLIGDSFSVIYSKEVPGFTWGTDAGLPEHLMARLGTRIEVITALGSGSTAVRRALVEKHGSLQGKKLIIWELAARLIMMDETGMKNLETWERVKIPATGTGTYGLEKAAAANTSPGAETGLPPGAVAKVRAKVTAIAAFPDPTTTRSPYPNLLTEVTCKVGQTLAGQAPAGSINILCWAFKQNKLTGDLPQVGDELELTLTPQVPPDVALEQRVRAEPTVDANDEEVIVLTYWPLEYTNLTHPAAPAQP